jgi:hypothetical protein
MRRVLVFLAVAALAVGAAEAAFGSVPVLLRTPGAEFVELQDGNGRAAVTGRGALNIQLDRGRIRVIDLSDPGRPNLSDGKRCRAHRVSRRTVEIRGRDLRCLVWSGENGAKWQVIIRGRGINAAGSVKGSLTLDAADRGPTGRFKIGEQGWRNWPRRAHTYVLNGT